MSSSSSSAASSAVSLKQKRKEEQERAEEERSRRRWERNYSSEDSTGAAELEGDALYCAHCSSFALIVDKKWERLPCRRTDKARAVDTKQSAVRHQMVAGPTKLIRRNNPASSSSSSSSSSAPSIERQYRLNCKQCQLFLAYRATEDESGILYLLPDAFVTDPALVARKLAALPMPKVAAASSASSA